MDMGVVAIGLTYTALLPSYWWLHLIEWRLVQTALYVRIKSELFLRFCSARFRAQGGRPPKATVVIRFFPLRFLACGLRLCAIVAAGILVRWVMS